MLPWIFVTLWVLGSVGVSGGQQCTASSQCVVGQCCRRDGTNTTIVYNPSAHLLGWLNSQSGQCVDGGAGPGEGCDLHCTCPPGYVCYRRLTGVCCGGPSTCITDCEAQKLRIRERCFPPPMAPPPPPGAGAGPGLSEARQRRRAVPVSAAVSADLICQLLLSYPSILDLLC